MKNILVPCDFSTSALNAYRLALDIAGLSNGKVHVLTVIELPVVPNTVFTPVTSLSVTLKKEMAAKARANYEKLVGGYNKEKIPTHFDVEFGTPSKVILSFAKKNKIDVILMGSHGASGMKEYFVGSNAEKIVRTSPVPVIVVKSFYKGSVKSIVVPYSIDQESHSGYFQKIKALQAFFKATLHFVWINTPANFTVDEVTYKRIEAIAKKFRLERYDINIYNQIYEEEGILSFAEAINADMIAMGTHGRKGLAHMVYGSKTENVANHGHSLIWTSVMK